MPDPFSVGGMPERQRSGREHGSASVELIGALPVLMVAALVVLQLSAAGFSLWSAGLAARAGARSALVGEDAEETAREALPGLLREEAEVSDEEGVSVEVLIPRVLPVLPEMRVGAAATLEAGDG